MIEKTRGIVLHQIKYTDSGIIAQMFTRKSGRQSFLIRGARNRKSGRHGVFLQPMFILDIDTYNKESRSMQTLKEFSVHYTPTDIHLNVKKSCIAMFLGEVLTSVLREESPNEALYDYIERSLIYFDRCREGYLNFHIAFLAGLSSFLGFEPSQRQNSSDRYFDMMNGNFVASPPSNGLYADREVSAVLSDFFSSSFETSKDIPLTGILRNEVLDTLMKYYSIHLPGLKKIRSLEVLKEVFS
jgi:DNA repair protein RecO (recombination protein O)